MFFHRLKKSIRTGIPSWRSFCPSIDLCFLRTSLQYITSKDGDDIFFLHFINVTSDDCWCLYRLYHSNKNQSKPRKYETNSSPSFREILIHPALLFCLMFIGRNLLILWSNCVSISKIQMVKKQKSWHYPAMLIISYKLIYL